MFVLGPKTAYSVLGLFVFLGLLDGALRSRIFPLGNPVCNEGVAFGISLPTYLLWSFIGATLIAVLSRALRMPFSGANLAWAAIFIGGLINALDRLAHGCVTDYLHLPFFPSFNLADIMLSLGVVVLAASLLGVASKTKPYVS